MLLPGRHVSALSIVSLALAGCGGPTWNAPRKVDDAPAFAPMTSVIAVPVSTSLRDLAATLDREVPRVLWTIDRVEPRCVPAQRVAGIKVLSDLSCRITGRVTRGPIAVSGSGSRLLLRLPIRAEISANNVGGVVRRETATGSAAVTAAVTLGMRPDWTPSADVDLRYDWTEPPGVTVLGQRITFTDQADAKLKQVVAGLKRDLPRQLAALHLRDTVAGGWRQAFTSVALNDADPPVWLRITPRAVAFGGYHLSNGRIAATAAAQALTETFVGDRPPEPAVTPLPPLGKQVGKPHLVFQVPILASYAQLEPVVLRALRRLAAQGIAVPKLGLVDARFDAVTVYATTGSKLAVGITVSATPRSGMIGTTKGQLWLTGRPYNLPNSEVVEIRDLAVGGDTDSRSVDLLIGLAQAPALLETVRGALTQDFARDYAKVLTSARRAIAAKRLGDFVLEAAIDRVDHGSVAATGRGLYLPVTATGSATVRYAPR